MLSFENEDDVISYEEYYMPAVEIKDYYVLIDNKSFFDIPIKKSKKHMKRLLRWEEIVIIIAIEIMAIYWIKNIFQSIID